MGKLSLSEIFEKPISGEWGKDPQDENQIKVIKTNNILNNGKINYDKISLRDIDEKKVKSKKLEFGDILIEKSGGSPTNPVGRVCYFNRKDDTYLTNNFMSSLRVSNKRFYHHYVFYALFYLYRTRVVLNFQNQTTGIINLKLDRYLKTIKLNEINLSKQKQIADTLDKANELIELRKESIKKLDELSKSIFIDMFGTPADNHKNFEIGTIRDLVNEVKYGTSSKASEIEGEYPVLRMNNITYSGYLDMTSLKYLDLDDNEKEKYLLKKGDLLFNRTNSKELVGKTTIYNLDNPVAYAGYLIRVRCESIYTNLYISHFLNSIYGKQTLQNMCKAIVGMANINAQELQNIKILMPSIDLQEEFAEKIEKIEQQKALYEKQLKKLQYNFDALLAKSFEE